tara:strand:+ start:60 stop:251 length:192 start_codon:yes stop_codon:yes gene_type:complete
MNNPKEINEKRNRKEKEIRKRKKKKNKKNWKGIYTECTTKENRSASTRTGLPYQRPQVHKVNE